MGNNRGFLLVLTFICTAIFFSERNISWAEPEHLIKFATVAPEGTAWINHMEALDAKIREKSGGKLGFKIYSGAVVGDELDVLRRIRIGQIQCAAFSGVGFGRVLPMVRVLDLPFLFRNSEEIDLVHKRLQSFFGKEFEKRGFSLLAWAEVGNAHLFSKKPIKTVDDLSRLKIWAWSGDPIAKETFRAMGVNPIVLPITGVNTALNTKMINTVYAPPLGAMALQWHSSMKYMTALPFAHSTGAVLISKKFLERLPSDLVEMLKSGFQEEMSILTTELREQNKEAVKLLQDESGITVIPAPTGQDLDEFRKVHKTVAGRLAGDLYPKEVLEKVYSIVQQTRQKKE